MDEVQPRPARRVPLLGWVVIAVLVAAGVAIAIPALLKSRVIAQQYNARAALSGIGGLEAQWKQHDYDRNGVVDYWTRDWAGFHCIQGDNGGGVGLIDLSLARADKAPAMRAAELSGGSVAWEGYYFQAMLTDQDGNPYLQEGLPPPKARNAPAGVCTNMAHFGFTSFPNHYGVDGNQVFFIGEDGVVWEKDCGRSEAVLDRKVAAPESAGSGWSQL